MRSFRTLLAVTAICFAVPAIAGENIAIRDAYARATTAMSVSGAAFMVIENHGPADDRLMSVTTDAAERAELHTHEEDAAGVMRMIHVEDGFPIPAGGYRALDRGGDHVMLLGLRRPLQDGDALTLTLTFEAAGEIVLEIPVDLHRPADHGGGHGAPAAQDHGQGHGH